MVVIAELLQTVCVLVPAADVKVIVDAALTAIVPLKESLTEHSLAPVVEIV